MEQIPIWMWITIFIFLALFIWSLLGIGEPSVDVTPEEVAFNKYIKELTRIGIECEKCGTVCDADDLIKEYKGKCPECNTQILDPKRRK